MLSHAKNVVADERNSNLSLIYIEIVNSMVLCR